MGSKEEIVAAIADTGSKIKAIKEEKVPFATIPMQMHVPYALNISHLSVDFTTFWRTDSFLLYDRCTIITATYYEGRFRSFD